MTGKQEEEEEEEQNDAYDDMTRDELKKHIKQEGLDDIVTGKQIGRAHV